MTTTTLPLQQQHEYCNNNSRTIKKKQKTVRDIRTTAKLKSKRR